MKIGVIADDFTGASDIALTLAEAGMAVTQFIGVPHGSSDAALGAGVVALKSRSAPVDEAVADSLAACNWLLAQGARQIVFKVCSTFDSTAEGNIGPVLDALAARLSAGPVMVCPAFPENGRSVYLGHLFVGDRLLNESGMETHPLTPMRDADLRRVLAAQSVAPVHHVPIADVASGAAAIRHALPDTGYAIVDAIADADLRAIGAAAQGARLICGGSGIALGLPANFDAVPGRPSWTPVTGPGVVLSGSCSTATRGQVARYRDGAPSLEITAEAAMSGDIDPTRLADWALSHTAPPLIYSSADPETVRAAQSRFGRAAVADRIEEIFAALAAALRHAGVTRIVVAGGETSGAVVRGLGATALRIGPRLAAGVPALRCENDPSLALALKSGNFGGPDFFRDALGMMETGA
ncbi:MAG: 3-oxo-tetronate kinase [Pseudomonadota bacterium]